MRTHRLLAALLGLALLGLTPLLSAPSAVAAELLDRKSVV